MMRFETASCVACEARAFSAAYCQKREWMFATAIEKAKSMEAAHANALALKSPSLTIGQVDGPRPHATHRSTSPAENEKLVTAVARVAIPAANAGTAPKRSVTNVERKGTSLKSAVALLGEGERWLWEKHAVGGLRLTTI